VQFIENIQALLLCLAVTEIVKTMTSGVLSIELEAYCT
jgi:hypothetical protein